MRSILTAHLPVGDPGDRVGLSTGSHGLIAGAPPQRARGFRNAGSHSPAGH